MPKLALFIGGLLILLGVAAYVISGAASVTALIPAFIGAPLALLGYVAGQKEAYRKHAMHAAAALALIGLLGSFGGIGQTATLIAGGDVERPLAAVVRALTALALGTFVVLAVRSFINARKQQRAAA